MLAEGRGQRVEEGEHAGVIGALLTGLNSSGGVIIIIDASRFERAENRERVSVIGALLT